MSFFVDPENLLDLRLRLEHEVLGTPATEDHDTALPATTLRIENDRSRLVHIPVGIEQELISVERQRRDVHSDRAVARRRRIDRDSGGVRGG